MDYMEFIKDKPAYNGISRIVENSSENFDLYNYPNDISDMEEAMEPEDSELTERDYFEESYMPDIEYPKDTKPIDISDLDNFSKGLFIPKCQDSAYFPLEDKEITYTGRLLNVDVTVNACEKRNVIVGVIVCDPTGETVLRFKAAEACMPPAIVPGETCVTKTFNFCFVFQKDLCEEMSLIVKTIVEYTSFDFPCSCIN